MRNLDFLNEIHKANYVFIASTAVVIGKVTLGENASVWYGAVIRGDIAPIFIGARSNIQDNCVIHVNYNMPVTIGEQVTIGHGAIIHGASIGNNCLIGMGAIVLDGAQIGDNCLVAAGAVVPPRSEIPPGSMVAGVPAKVVRELSAETIEANVRNALEYVELAARYQQAIPPVM